MPEIVELEGGEQSAADRIAALQDVPAEQEDVLAHSMGVSTDPAVSTVSVGSYCDITT